MALPAFARSSWRVKKVNIRIGMTMKSAFLSAFLSSSAVQDSVEPVSEGV